MHSRFSRSLLATALLPLATFACTTEPMPVPGSDPATEIFATSLGVNLSQMTKVSNALYMQDLVVGTGASAVTGNTLGVTYTGWLVSGVSFDSNVGKAVFSFPVGQGFVIGGWDQGLIGLKVGGKRRLIIGSDLGYGASGAGCAVGQTPTCSIPPNSTLVFDVQLLSIK